MGFEDERARRKSTRVWARFSVSTGSVDESVRRDQVGVADELERR